jgi:BASS family bile acid:Na+ symporter
MKTLANLLRNRDFILFSALVLGMVFHSGAQWTKPFILPVLAVVMTLSTLSISDQLFRSPKRLIVPTLVGIGMNYLLLAGAILALGRLLIHQEDLWRGFVLVAAVPPAVAVVPFTDFLNGDKGMSLIATTGTYLGALIIMPAVAFGLLGSSFVQPARLLVILLELIIAPVVVSRVLRWSGAADRLTSIKGLLTNWSFFLVIYTIVGLNSDMFIKSPASLAPVALVAVGITFVLGWLIERLSKATGLSPALTTTLVLLGTQKNCGLAGGIALTMFNQQAALPAAVATVFMITFFIRLRMKRRGVERPPDRPY